MGSPARSRWTNAARRKWNTIDRALRRELTWNRIYRATSYARSALWIVPFIAVAGVFVMHPIVRALDAWLGWRLVGLGLQGTQSLYNTVITLNLSFLVFTFSSLIVAIQIASGQLTPRVIATTLLRDNVVRYSVGLFVFTLMFAVRALNRIEDIRQEIVTLLTGTLGVATVVTFLFLIDYAARLLRPVSILARIGDEGLQVIRSLYRALETDETDPRETVDVPQNPTRRVVMHHGRSEIVLAVDLETIMRLARRTRGIIEFVPRVGDFVADGEPLFVLYGDATAIGDAALHTAVAFGLERTMEQDALFSLRIMVDIALKSLSPAINDPTTAVLALDQIQRLLRVAGRHRLHSRGMLRDGLGRPRVVCRTPDWDDFVHLACTEIRTYGAGNVQIARRLRALLDNLIALLPAFRQAELVAERERLDLAIRAAYSIPSDLALASAPDVQGLGGSSGARVLK